MSHFDPKVRSLAPWPLIFVLSAMISACMVGPDYQGPPAVAGPSPDWTRQQLGAAASSPPWWRSLQDAQIEQLVALALAHNPDLQASRQRIVQARSQRDAVAAALLPQVGAQASVQSLQQSENGPLPLKKLPIIPRYEQIHDAEFDASWDLDLFGARRRAVQSAQAQQQAEVAAAEDLRKSLVAELVRNVFSLRAQQAQLQTLEQALTLAQQSRRSIARQVAQGELPASALDDAEQQEKLWAAQLPLLQASRQGSVYAIALLCGQTPQWGLHLLQERQPLPILPPLPLDAAAAVLARRPDVRMAERRLAAATANIGAAKAQWFPQISIGAAIGYQSLQGSNWFSAASQTSDLMPLLHWRIFSAGQIQAEVHFAQAQQKEQAYAYAHSVLSALADVEQHLAAAQQARLSWDQEQAAVAAADRSSRHAQHAFAAGEIDLQQRILSDLQHEQALLAEEQSQEQALNAWVAVNKALAWPVE